MGFKHWAAAVAAGASGLVRRPRLALPVLALSATAALAAATAPAAAGAVNPDTLSPQVSRTSCGHGVWAINTVPASGFNPLTATTSELNANNYPLPPPVSDRSGYAQWKRFVVKPAATRSSCPAAGHGVTAREEQPAAGVEQPAEQPAAGGPTAWSGWVVHNDTFTDAEATWTVPPVSGVAGTDDYSASWVGLGLGENGTDVLAQAGTEANYLNGADQYYLWYEVYPLDAEQPLVYVNPDDAVGAHVTVVNDGAAEFHIWDDSIAYNENLDFSGTFVNDGHAEWIYERPCFENSSDTECVVSYLADAAPTFNSAQAAVTGAGWFPLGALDYYSQTMYNCPGTQELAFPGSISGDGLSYSDYYEHHGDDDCQATI